jgi:hypothetical protein
MGAEQPKRKQTQQVIPNQDTPTKKRAGVLLWLVLGLALLLVYLSLGEPDFAQLSPQETDKLQKRLKEIDDSEQYALVAAIDGFYPCLHSGHKTYYLKTGEVWKYGVTSKGALGRYAASFLVKNRVSYLVQFKGNFAECLKQEQIKLFGYPYLPENQVRPLALQLPRPPYNPVMR